MIVDKTSARVSKSGSRYSAATYLSSAGIPVWVDSKGAIADNTVMDIARTTILAGRYNLTAAVSQSIEELPPMNTAAGVGVD